MFKKASDIVFLVSLAVVLVVGAISAKDIIQEFEINRVHKEAEKGNVREQERLGDFYRIGLWTVEKNDYEAICWYKRANTRYSNEVLCNEYHIGCPNAENSQ